MSWRVGVVVPARDEQDRIAACLESVAAAVRRAGRPTLVCVVADRCRDATAALARAAGVEVVVNRRPLCIGEVRNLGFRRVTGSLGGVTERTWLLGPAPAPAPRGGPAAASPTCCARSPDGWLGPQPRALVGAAGRAARSQRWAGRRGVVERCERPDRLRRGR